MMRFTQNTKIYLVDACYTYEIFSGTLLVKYFLPVWLQTSYLLTGTALQNNLKQLHAVLALSLLNFQGMDHRGLHRHLR